MPKRVSLPSLIVSIIQPSPITVLSTRIHKFAPLCMCVGGHVLFVCMRVSIEEEEPYISQTVCSDLERHRATKVHHKSLSAKLRLKISKTLV